MGETLWTLTMSVSHNLANSWDNSQEVQIPVPMTRNRKVPNLGAYWPNFGGSFGPSWAIPPHELDTRCAENRLGITWAAATPKLRMSAFVAHPKEWVLPFLRCSSGFRVPVAWICLDLFPCLSDKQIHSDRWFSGSSIFCKLGWLQQSRPATRH